MLSRRRTAATAALTLAVLTTPAHARADEPGTGGTACGKFTCEAEAKFPGQSGTGKPGGGSGTDQAGDGSGNNGAKANNSKPPVCKTKKLEPQPPAGSSVWEGHDPKDGGAIYIRSCRYTSKTGASTVIEEAVYGGPGGPPAAPPVDPAVVAQRAVDKMLLRGPEIGITPKPGGKGVVGMPVYLWTEKGPETYGPNTASATAGAVTVTATAKVSKIVWSMGDGKTVTCSTAGTPYKASYGKKPSPDCGHRYSSPSSTTSSGKFHVTATSTWTIDWQVTGGGQAGELTEIRDSAVDITVAEVQVLN